MNTLKCIVVDDDEIDRLTTVSFVKRYLQLQLVGIFEDAEKALKDIDFKEIDVLFLDIDMPGLSGIELRKKINEVPACIFITAYPEHAVDSFSIETLDFIVKPLKKERFAQTIERLEQFMAIHKKANLYENYIGGSYINIKEGHSETKINLHEILYLEGLKDYTLIVTENKKYCVLYSIGNLLKVQSFEQFIRVHRSFAVRKDIVKTKNTNELILNNDMIVPIGRSFRDNLIFLL